MGVLIWSAIGALGGCGAILRFALDGAVSARAAGTFPLGTLVVNGVGSFLLGLLVGLGAGGDGLRLAGLGLLGSFTTFSTWMLEGQRQAEDGLRRASATNLLASLVLGFALAWLGLRTGEAL